MKNIELFKANVRKVGNLLKILTPKEVVNIKRIREGEEVEIGILKQRKIKKVLKLIGIAKGTKPFERDKLENTF